MKKYFALFMVTGLLLFSCKKNNVGDPGNPVPVPGPQNVLITESGTPVGEAVSMTIGPSGGTISSTDGKITVNIPAGALSANQTIIVQPIGNKLGSGVGNAFRLLPHNLQFAVPVSITFKYTDADIAASVPELLGIAFQKDDGSWRSQKGAVANKTDKSVTVTSTHFSDWGLFEQVYLSPANARVEKGGGVDLAVMYAVDPNEIEIPNADGSPLYPPFPLQSQYVGSWHYAGEGILTSRGATGSYLAPDHVPGDNPEVVSVDINLNTKGRYILLSHITVLSEFRISYMQVDETETNIATNPDYASRLVLYGNFGNDPGSEKRSVTINGSSLNVMFWTPRVIVCEFYTQGPLSSGNVTVTKNNETDSKILNEWMVSLVYNKVETPGGALTRKFVLNLRIRGDAAGSIPEGVTNLVPYTDLNVRSKAIIEMPGGSFTNHVTQDDCGDYTVKWDPLHEVAVDRIPYSQSGPGLRGQVVFSSTGIQLKLKFLSAPILKSTRSYSPCVGNSQQQVVMEPLELLGYQDQEILLHFDGNGLGSKILAGLMPEIQSSGVASGMYFDFDDTRYLQCNTTFTWAEAVPKYQ